MSETIKIRRRTNGRTDEFDLATFNGTSWVGYQPTYTELATVNGVTAGTVTASKAVVVGASKQVNEWTVTSGALTVTGGAITQSQTVSTAALGTVRGVHGQVTASHAAISGGNVVGARGLVTLSGVNSAGGAYFYGSQGKLIVTGTMNHADSRLCASIAQIDGTGGTFTAGQLSGLWIDVVGISGAAGGQFNLIRATCANGVTPNAILYAQTDATYLFDLGKPTGDTQTYVEAAGTGANSAGLATGGVAAKVMKVLIDGTDYWVPLFSSNGS